MTTLVPGISIEAMKSTLVKAQMAHKNAVQDLEQKQAAIDTLKARLVAYTEKVSQCRSLRRDLQANQTKVEPSEFLVHIEKIVSLDGIIERAESAIAALGSEITGFKGHLVNAATYEQQTYLAKLRAEFYVVREERDYAREESLSNEIAGIVKLGQIARAGSDPKTR